MKYFNDSTSELKLKSTRLINRPTLFEDESLASYVVRLAAANYCQPVQSLTRLILTLTPPDHSTTAIPLLQGRKGKGNNAVHNLHLPIQPQTYTRLSDLTGFAPPKFYLATAHSYAPLLVAPTAKQYYLEPEPENELTGVGQKHLWSLLTASRDTSLIRAETQAQFCPLCLILGLYHRRVWSVTSVTICLVHKVLLISRCPGCKNSLTIGEVTLGRCRGCGAEVRAALPVFVGDDETGIILQTILQGWLDWAAQNALKLNLIAPVSSGGRGENSLTLASNGTTSTKTEVASTPDINLNLAVENRVKLPDQPAATLYATMEGLRKAIDLTTKETWPYRHKPVLTQPLLELEAVEAAFILIIAVILPLSKYWPIGLVVFMNL